VLHKTSFLQENSHTQDALYTADGRGELNRDSLYAFEKPLNFNNNFESCILKISQFYPVKYIIPSLYTLRKDMPGSGITLLFS